MQTILPGCETIHSFMAHEPPLDQGSITNRWNIGQGWAWPALRIDDLREEAQFHGKTPTTCPTSDHELLGM